MAVNVLDSVTGLTYAVEYKPANLVRKPKEYEWSDIEILVGGHRMPVVPIDGTNWAHGKYLRSAINRALVKESPSEKDAPEPTKPTDFIQRAREIADELNAMAEADPNFAKKCGVAFFTMQKKADGKSFSGVAFLGGNKKNIIDGMVAATDDGKNTDVVDVLSTAGKEAELDYFINQHTQK